MQRTIWEWLGIEKTTDKSRIKKAYAEQVKKYHPEEFPEEAQALRKAYKDAMALASAGRIVSEWADSGIEQEISLIVKDLGHVSTESLHFDSQPEPDPEVKPEYVYTKTVPPGMQPEPAPEVKPEYIYTKTVPPGIQPEPDPEVEREYNFASPELPHAMAMRIDDLKKRMDAIYGTDYRNFAKEWRRAFADYPNPEDLRDIRAVWEIFTAIEPMSRLNGATWEILQTELFRYREDTASWQLLQERFDAVRRPYVAPAQTPVKTPYGTCRKVVQPAYVAPTQTPVKTPPKKTSLKEFCIIFFVIVILLGSVSLHAHKGQDWKSQQRMLEFQQQIAEGLQQESSVVLISREALQAAYTKAYPREMDLNQDEIPDHIYYDPDEGLFMVELYDAPTDSYHVYGSVDQYLEENPEMNSIKGLRYFTCGGKSIR